MGTSCITIYVHKGVYYMLNARRHDGYPREEGVSIVSEIPGNSERFEAWLRSEREYFDEEEERIERLDQEYEDECIHWSEREYEPYIQKPSCKYKVCPWFNYKYVIDLDDLIFSINGSVCFPLQNIPRGKNGDLWITFLDFDGIGSDILRPDTPRRYCKRNYYDDDIPEEGLAIYNSFAQEDTIIDESIWSHRGRDNTRRVLASAITKDLMMCHNSRFHRELLDSAASYGFHAIAEILLRAASPSGFLLSSSAPDSESIRYSSYRDDSPSTIFYRYRCCVVLLAGYSSSLMYLEANIGLAVAHARETGKDSCTVIIFSILHVAVAVIEGAITGNLKVSHSRSQPLFDGFGYEGPDKGLDLLAYYLRPRCVDGATTGEDVNHNLPSLPMESLLQIMYMVDARTYDTFGLTCKALREEWYLRPRIGEYTIFDAVYNAVTIEAKEKPYLPSCILRVMRENGNFTWLYVFYEAECPGFDPDPEQYDYAMSCCRCSSLCHDKQCCWRASLLIRPAPSKIRTFCKSGDTANAYRDGEGGQRVSEGSLNSGLFILEKNEACQYCVRCVDAWSPEKTGQ